jgi:hypothetical protein
MATNLIAGLAHPLGGAQPAPITAAAAQPERATYTRIPGFIKDLTVQLVPVGPFDARQVEWATVTDRVSRTSLL